MDAISTEAARRNEILRYIANGLFATAVHFGVLTFCLRVLGFSSAGVANLVAAALGIAVSFTGNRYFVFRRFERSLVRQAMRFGVLYAGIAAIHGLLLFLWTDLLSLDYRVGFVIAMVIQVALSYIGNKKLVFQ